MRRGLLKSPGRMIALFLILLLGAGTFVGLRSSGPSLKKTADRYFEQTGLADFRLFCDMGITAEDIDAAAGLPGVSNVSPAYAVDVLVSAGDQASFVFSVRSLPEQVPINPAGLTSDPTLTRLSHITLTEGRMPAASNECVADVETNLSIGDIIEVTDENDPAALGWISQKHFTIVGIAMSPVYISIERGASSIGSGQVSQYLYVPESVFGGAPYSELSLRLDATEGLSAFSADYREAISSARPMIEEFGRNRAEARYQSTLAGVSAFGWGDFKAETSAANSADKGLGEVPAAYGDAPGAEFPPEPPVWLIQDRTEFPGYSNFEDGIDRVDKLSLIIPWFIFLIAILVCLTSMTRMIEEHHTMIGTLKSMGYHRNDLLPGYQAYAWCIGLSGGASGVVLGVVSYPRIVWAAYSSLYSMSPFVIAINLPASIAGLLGCASIIAVATALAGRWALGASVSTLMRPKAPRIGKRVFFERIPFLWNRFSFKAKVTSRNLLRYKKRFFITLFGVSSCSAILLAGFGIRDSLSGMAALQYGDIAHMQATLYLESPSDSREDSPLNEGLSGLHTAYIHGTAIHVFEDGKRNEKLITYLYVPEQPREFNRFITLRDKRSGEAIPFPPPSDGFSAIITERLAKALKIEIGGEISFGYPAKAPVSIKITGIAENYHYNYIYLTPAAYAALFDRAPEYNAVLLSAGLGDAELDTILKDLVATGNVASALPVSYFKDIIDKIVYNMGAVVWLMIISASLLAIVVLYNLSNVNIGERERELATLKVLGFYPGEVTSYIAKEMMIMTLISIVVGLVCGALIHGWVMESIEGNNFMFSRVILKRSFLIAAAFTLVCSFLATLIMLPRLKRIEPVIALKSVE